MASNWAPLTYPQRMFTPAARPAKSRQRQFCTPTYHFIHCLHVIRLVRSAGPSCNPYPCNSRASRLPPAGKPGADQGVKLPVIKVREVLEKHVESARELVLSWVRRVCNATQHSYRLHARLPLPS